MDIESHIQAAILEPTSNLTEVLSYCELALSKNINAVVVPPTFVEQVYEKFKTTDLVVSTVVSYPYGFAPASSKVEEIVKAINSGADQIDVVINLSAVKSGMWNKINHELDRVTTMSNIRNKDLNLIIQSAALTDEEIVKICQLGDKHNVQYIGTSTDYLTPIDSSKISLIKQSLPKSIKISVAGKIKDKSEAQSLINAGVSRITTQINNEF